MVRSELGSGIGCRLRLGSGNQAEISRGNVQGSNVVQPR